DASGHPNQPSQSKLPAEHGADLHGGKKLGCGYSTARSPQEQPGLAGCEGRTRATGRVAHVEEVWSTAARRHQSAWHRSRAIALVFIVIIAFATGAVLRLGFAFFNPEKTGRSAAENREAKSRTR